MVGFSDHPQKIFKKSLNRRKDSEEMDVFDAAKYFSGAIESETYPNTTTAAPFVQCPKPGGRRLSLDMPVRKVISSQTGVLENQTKERKHKQPSSPGGRFAKILNALFNQTSLKKVKSKTWSSANAKSVKDDDDEINTTTPDWRRKRRSSMSNFQLQSSKIQPKQNSSESFNSGFRTPPVYSQIPKSSSYKKLWSYSNHKEISPYVFKNHGNENPSVISIGMIKDGNFKHDRYSPPEEREFSKFSEADDGADSDLSSDLFDLPNCEHDLYTSALPVYESKYIESIKRYTGCGK